MAVRVFHNFAAEDDVQYKLGVASVDSIPSVQAHFASKIVFAFVIALAVIFINSVEAAPPVNKSRPFDDYTSSCFFQGKLSLYSKKYNILEDFCVNFYGKLEFDADMTTVQLQDIVSLHGCLIMRKTKISYANFRQLKELTSDPELCEYNGLLIYDNPSLNKIEFNSDFKPDPNDIFIRKNPRLKQNGIIDAKFQVDIGTSKTECFVGQATPNANCKTLIGDVSIKDLNRIGRSRIRSVAGKVIVKKTDVENVEALRRLKIVGWGSPALIISENADLVDISALPTTEITGKYPTITIKNNPKLCDNIVNRNEIRKWLSENRVPSIKIGTYCLKSCNAGEMSEDFLLNLDKHCNVLNGDLIIHNFEDLPRNIGKLEQLEQVNGRVLITDNSNLQELTFLKNIKRIENPAQDTYPYSLMIYGNSGLSKIEFCKDFKPKRHEIFIRLNPKLTINDIMNANFNVDIGTKEGGLFVYGIVDYEEWGDSVHSFLIAVKNGPKDAACAQGWRAPVELVVGNEISDEITEHSYKSPYPNYFAYFSASLDCFFNLAHKLADCTTLIGDVNYEELPFDIWERVGKIEGTLTITDTKVENLDFLRGLSIVGWRIPAFVISHNLKLIDIGALMTVDVRSSPPVLVMEDNPNICHNIGERRELEKFLKKIRVSVPFSQDCLISCAGGKVDDKFLEHLDKRCNVIDGNLVINGMTKLPSNIKKLEQVEIINGRLFVTNNPAVENLLFLRNLREINNPELYEPGLVVKNNRMTKISGLLSLEKVTGGQATAITTFTVFTSTMSKLQVSTTKGRKSTRTKGRIQETTTIVIQKPETTINDEESLPNKELVSDSQKETERSETNNKRIWIVLIILLLVLLWVAVIIVVIIVKKKRRGKGHIKDPARKHERSIRVVDIEKNQNMNDKKHPETGDSKRISLKNQNADDKKHTGTGDSKVMNPAPE
ncbi:hypothetical protein RB195_011761 [Necator americanus]|uniref:Receptor L-domain domain-containing protein n=1 Tax=Necator americanus TaxID=51031 RepID=A0ABR1D3X3_NECAM